QSAAPATARRLRSATRRGKRGARALACPAQRSSAPALELRGCATDGPADARVSAAAAEVGERRDVGIARRGPARDEIHGRHDLARLAVAALSDVLLDPGLLDRV